MPEGLRIFLGGKDTQRFLRWLAGAALAASLGVGGHAVFSPGHSDANLEVRVSVLESQHEEDRRSLEHIENSVDYIRRILESDR